MPDGALRPPRPAGASASQRAGGVPRGRVDRVGQREAMGGPGPGGRRRHVAEAELVVRPAPGRLAGVEGRLSLVGPDDPHPFGRWPLGEPIVPILALVHGASSLRHWSPCPPAPTRRPCRIAQPRRSDGEQLLFLVVQHPVDLRHVLVGDPLQLLLGPVELVATRCRRPSRDASRSLRAARRRLRTATRPSSALWWTTLTISLRRSSVSWGKVSRMTIPSLLGIDPEVGVLDGLLDGLEGASCRRG